MNDNELQHHGILGQRWGVRRFQNEDGSYTKSGMARYNKANAKYKKALNDYKNSGHNKAYKQVLRVAKENRAEESKRLAKDVLADKGKKLHDKGFSSEERSKLAGNAFYASGVDALIGLGSQYIYNNTGLYAAKLVRDISFSAALGQDIAGLIALNQKRKLSEYESRMK